MSSTILWLKEDSRSNKLDQYRFLKIEFLFGAQLAYVWQVSNMYPDLSSSNTHSSQNTPFSSYTLSASQHRPRNVPISRKDTYYRASVCGMALLSVMLIANWAAYLSSPTFLTVENVNTPSFLIPPFILYDSEPHHLQLNHQYLG